MTHSGDVEKRASDFLAELNALGESLGASRGSSPESASAPGNDPPATAKEPAVPVGLDREAELPQPIPSRPIRNIDILLMDDAPPPPVPEKIDETDLFHSCKALYESRLLRLGRAARRRTRLLAWAAAALVLICLAGGLYYNLNRSKTDFAAAPPTAASAPGGSPILPAVAVDKIVPIYPPAARRRGIRGVVEVLSDVDEHGRVVRAVAVSGPPLLRSAAAQAVTKCRFRPAQRNGVPLKSTVKLSIAFPGVGPR